MMLKSKGTFGIAVGNFLTILFFDGLTDNLYDKKFKILKIEKMDKGICHILIDGIVSEDIFDNI